MIGETNRAPFDLAEAEGELVGGFHTEYSSLKFALFFLAEYINIATVSALATTLFLGGYRALPGLGFTEQWFGGWFGMVWFLLKVALFFNIFVWVRATLPRIRYDQFMKFGWKILIPSSLLWIIIVATLRALSTQGAPRIVVAIFAGGVVLLIMALTSLWDRAKQAAKEQPELDVEAPSFPVPTLPSMPNRPISGGN
jgi:NADH-quinone oxidoreductase subunit H